MLKIISMFNQDLSSSNCQEIKKIIEIIELYKDLNQQLDLLLEKVRLRKSQIN